jgi:hypothetical protein
MLVRVLGLRVNGQDIGSSIFASSGRSNRKESSLKTSQPFELEDWEQSFVASTRSGMMQSGTVSPLPPLALATRGTEFGYLPTCVAREGRDWSRFSILGRLDRGDGVAKRICNKSTTTPSDDPIVGLNPSFAEWMFLYPEGWTDLNK